MPGGAGQFRQGSFAFLEGPCLLALFEDSLQHCTEVSVTLVHTLCLQHDSMSDTRSDCFPLYKLSKHLYKMSVSNLASSYASCKRNPIDAQPQSHRKTCMAGIVSRFRVFDQFLLQKGLTCSYSAFAAAAVGSSCPFWCASSNASRMSFWACFRGKAVGYLCSCIGGPCSNDSRLEPVAF